MEFVPWTSFARIVQRHRGNAVLIAALPLAPSALLAMAAVLVMRLLMQGKSDFDAIEGHRGETSEVRHFKRPIASLEP